MPGLGGLPWRLCFTLPYSAFSQFNRHLSPQFTSTTSAVYQVHQLECHRGCQPLASIYPAPGPGASPPSQELTLLALPMPKKPPHSTFFKWGHKSAPALLVLLEVNVSHTPDGCVQMRTYVYLGRRSVGQPWAHQLSLHKYWAFTPGLMPHLPGTPPSLLPSP